jgi:hypothetical protein
MNIIGLGNAGCQIAKKFEKYEQYSVFCVDTENKGYSRFIRVKEQNSHEDYEKNYKKIDLSACKGPTTFIINGSGKISGVALRILNQIKDNPIVVLYIKTVSSQLSGQALLRDRATFGILQQYTRSAIFDRMYVVSNNKVEQLIEDLSFKNYWDDINEVISSTYHMVNVFNNTEPLLSNLPFKKETVRIGTFGVINYETNKEKLFYDLEHTRMKKYFYGLNNSSEENDKDVLYDIRKFVEDQAGHNTESGFAIYSTGYEHNYVYSIHYASSIQEQVTE